MTPAVVRSAARALMFRRGWVLDVDDVVGRVLVAHVRACAAGRPSDERHLGRMVHAACVDEIRHVAAVSRRVAAVSRRGCACEQVPPPSTLPDVLDVLRQGPRTTERDAFHRWRRKAMRAS